MYLKTIPRDEIEPEVNNTLFRMCYRDIAISYLPFYFACSGDARAFVAGARDALLSRGFPERRRF